MTSSYNDIYDRFLRKVTDYKLASLLEPDATQRMKEWLQSSLSDVYIFRIFDKFSADDEIGQIEYTLKTPVNDYIDQNFVEELLGNAMVLQWISPKVKNTNLLNQLIGNSKEQKLYSQSSHLAQLRELEADADSKVRCALRDKGYIYNEYLGNV